MKATPKYLFLGALTGAALFGLVILAVEIPSFLGRQPVDSVEAGSVEEVRSNQSPEISGAADFQAAAGPRKIETAVVEPIPSLAPDSTSIPDEYLLRLSAMVDLPEATKHPPDKNRWRLAIMAAGKLLEGPCDCAQRNWLVRFVEMGNAALSDSGGQYRDSAILIASLGRNDEQAMARSQQTQ